MRTDGSEDSQPSGAKKLVVLLSFDLIIISFCCSFYLARSVPVSHLAVEELHIAKLLSLPLLVFA